jgi:hypothetical protein
MARLCSLLTHAASPHMVRNQGFDFSKCRRCGRDMIRSVEPRATKWRVVPAGFRIIWRNTDPHQGFRHGEAAPRGENKAHFSLIFDFLNVAIAAIYWNIADYLSRNTSRPEVIFRLGSR